MRIAAPRLATALSLSAAAIAVAIGCGGYEGAGSDDTETPQRADVDASEASSSDAAPPDALPDASAPPPCDLTKPFGAAVPVAELNTADTDILSSLSADALTAYVATNHGVAGVHLFFASRATTKDPFGALSTLFPTGAWDDFGVTVSTDGLTAIVSSTKGGNSDLYVATRTTTLAAFGALSPAAGLNTGAAEEGPRWSADGKTLYFDSTRSGNREIYRSVVTGSSFGAATLVAELSSSALDAVPVLSADELTIYFVSFRAPTPDGDIYVATRGSKSDPFSNIQVVPNVNSPSGVDAPSHISADGCTLYLSSTRGNTPYDAYVARRPN